MALTEGVNCPSFHSLDHHERANSALHIPKLPSSCAYALKIFSTGVEHTFRLSVLGRVTVKSVSRWNRFPHRHCLFTVNVEKLCTSRQIEVTFCVIYTSRQLVHPLCASSTFTLSQKPQNLTIYICKTELLICLFFFSSDSCKKQLSLLWAAVINSDITKPRRSYQNINVSPARGHPQRRSLNA